MAVGVDVLGKDMLANFFGFCLPRSLDSLSWEMRGSMSKVVTTNYNRKREERVGKCMSLFWTIWS